MLKFTASLSGRVQRPGLGVPGRGGLASGLRVPSTHLPSLEHSPSPPRNRGMANQPGPFPGVGTDGQREQLGARIAGTAPPPGACSPQAAGWCGLRSGQQATAPAVPPWGAGRSPLCVSLAGARGQSRGHPPGRAVLTGGPATSVNLRALGRRCPSLRALSRIHVCPRRPRSQEVGGAQCPVPPSSLEPAAWLPCGLKPGLWELLSPHPVSTRGDGLSLGPAPRVSCRTTGAPVSRLGPRWLWVLFHGRLGGVPVLRDLMGHCPETTKAPRGGPQAVREGQLPVRPGLDL